MAKKSTNIGYILPVESVSRKFARRVDTVGNKPTSINAWIGGATTSIASKSAMHSMRNFLVIRKYKRSSLPNANEIWAKQRFTAVSKAVALRRMDLSQITDDQIAFQAQLGQPGCVYSMKAYLWQLEGATYDQDHPRN